MAHSTPTTEDQLELAYEYQNQVLSNFDFGLLHAGNNPRYTNLSVLTKNASEFACEAMLFAAVEQKLYLNEYYVNGAGYAAHKAGVSYGEGRAMLRRQRDLQQLPSLRDDFRCGYLSRELVELVLDGWRADETCVDELGRLAHVITYDELKEKVRKIKANAKPKPGNKKKNSRLGFKPADDPFMQLLFGVFTNEEAAEIQAKLEPETDRVFRKMSKAGTFISRKHCRSQALLNLICNAGNGKAARAQVLFIFDYAAYQRGEKTLDQICDIPGIGAVAKERLLAHLKDAFIDIDLENFEDFLPSDADDEDKDGEPDGSGTTKTRKPSTRRPKRRGVGKNRAHPSHKYSAARIPPEWMRRRKSRHGRICAMRGCSMCVGLDLDHNEECRDGGEGCECNLDWLCRRHHQMKTLNRLKLEGPPGAKIFAPMRAGP